MSINRAARLIALLGSVCPTIVATAIYIGSTQISIRGQEQNIVFAIQTMLGGEALYRDPSRLPFVVTQYTPIYYELCFAICRWFALKPDDLRGIYLVGRVISTAATVGSSLVMVAILARYSRLDRMTRLTLAFMFPLAIGEWACAARPDPLYLLLVVASLWMAMRYTETLRLRMLVISAILLLAGFYTKQTALFLFPLPLLIPFARLGWRACNLRDVLVCLAVYGIGAVVMTPTMLLNFTVGLGNGIDLSAAFREVYVPTVLHRLPLLLAAGLACWQASFGEDWRPRAIGLAALWYLIVGVALAVKYGSSVNYLNEFLVGCLLLTGMAPCLASPHQEPRPRALVLLGLIVAGQAVAIYASRPFLRSPMVPREGFYAAGRALAADPELQGKLIMMLDSSAIVFVPDRATFVPVEVLESSAASGHFDIAPVTQAVRDGRLCFAIADPALIRGLLAGTSSRGNPDDWISVVGRTLLADFHPARRIGSRMLLSADSCDARSR